MSETDSWPQVIRDACWLWLRVDAGERDDQFAVSGNQIIYAIDATIAKLYAEPLATFRHCQMLGFLDDGILPDLAHVLGDLCLRRSETGRGLILLPGHDEEFVGVYRAVMRNREGRQTTTTTFDLRNLQSAAIFGLEANRIIEMATPAEYEKFAAFVYGEFEILSGMVRSRDFDVARWADFIARSRIRAAIDPVSDLPIPDPEDPALSRNEELWSNAIRSWKSRRKSVLRIEEDARALATLGWINDRLCKQGDYRRVVLLTLDTGIQTVAIRQPHLPGASYIRDPRQFIKELPSEIGSPFCNEEQRQSYGVAQWLRILLSPFSHNGEMQLQKIRDLAVTPLEHNIWRRVTALFKGHHRDSGNRRLDGARQEWGRFIRLGLNRYAISMVHNDPRLEKIAQIVQNGQQDGLVGALNDYIVEVTSDASVTSLIAGLYVSLGSRLLRGKSEVSVYRMPIAIWSFDPSQRNYYTKFIDEAIERRDLDAIDPRAEFSDQYRVHCNCPGSPGSVSSPGHAASRRF